MNLVEGFKIGDALSVQKIVINPKTGKPYSYVYVLQVLHGLRKNERIMDAALQVVQEREITERRISENLNK